MTNQHFSMQCAYIAKTAASWAGDIITSSDRLQSEAHTATVSKFTDEIRKKLDMLDAWSGRPER